MFFVALSMLPFPENSSSPGASSSPYLIGCSGYYYREWKGNFYPEKLPSTQWLPFYAQHFNTLEVNATFYRMPTLNGMKKWYAATPPDFQFTVKANQLFTHYRRMKDVASLQNEFYPVITEGLQEKLACVLYQFPAGVHFSEELLERILPLGQMPVLHAIEFRHRSWWQEKVYQDFEQAGLVFVNISLPGFPDIFVPNARAAYLRFHGKPELYKSAYSTASLQWWSSQFEAQPAPQLLAYFNNTWHGAAVENAKTFRSLL